VQQNPIQSPFMPNVKKGEKFTLANTNITELVLNQAPSGCDAVVVIDPTNSGTIALRVGKVAPANMTGQNLYAAGSKAFLRIGRNEKVYAQASGANQALTLEY